MSDLDDYANYTVRDWDGYGADPIPPEAARNAAPLFRVLTSAGIEVHDAPGADGTVGLEFEIGGVSYVLDFAAYKIAGRAKAA